MEKVTKRINEAGVDMAGGVADRKHNEAIMWKYAQYSWLPKWHKQYKSRSCKTPWCEDVNLKLIVT